MERHSKGIFISYRRAKNAGHAGRLGDRLGQHFGSHKVFIDVDNIEPGFDFVEAIEDALDSSEVLLAIIGENWLTVTDARGQPRLENPDDLVRLEIVSALKRKMRVIPVLVQQASMPRADELPSDLSALARRNAFELRDTRWNDDVRSLIHRLEKVVGSKEAEPPRSEHSSPTVEDTEKVVGSKEAEPPRSEHSSPTVEDTERSAKPPIASAAETNETFNSFASCFTISVVVVVGVAFTIALIVLLIILFRST